MKKSIACALINAALDAVLVAELLAFFAGACAVGLFGPIALVLPVAVAGTLTILGLAWTGRELSDDCDCCCNGLEKVSPNVNRRDS